MEIYCCIRRRIDLVQALHPRAFAFALGILPCQSFRDPELTIREFKRQAGIIDRELRRKLCSRYIRPPVRLFNANGRRHKDFTSQLIHLSDEYGSPKIAKAINEALHTSMALFRAIILPHFFKSIYRDTKSIKVEPPFLNSS